MTTRSSLTPPNALMVGTGEYTTGYVHGTASRSDKSAGVVALSLFDLRRRGRLKALHMAGTNGTKFPGIRQHLSELIGDRYAGMDTDLLTYPRDDVSRDPQAYLQALNNLKAGDIVIIFTPDDTHFDIAMAAIEHDCHVLIAKPLVKTVEQHRHLIAAAKDRQVLCAMEVHKRWDPLYADARDQIRRLGSFTYFSSYMSQPKTQLETFRAWAGKSSDISYYLNAHHIDFNHWAVADSFRPTAVAAIAATGVAQSMGIETEDTITLSTQWECSRTGTQASGIYTASWIAPKSDVHSQQRFHYMGSDGEIHIDQAHRGYSMSTDGEGFRSANPLFMKYEPDPNGRFAGQHGYGYRSIEAFIEAATRINAKASSPDDWSGKLATAEDTLAVTAILEAGRRSLDQENRRIRILVDEAGIITGLD